MASYLGLESGNHLLLESTDALLLETQDNINITFPPIRLDLFGSLTPWEGMTLGGIDDVIILAQLGDINVINVTFPLINLVIGNFTNTIGITFQPVNLSLYGVNNLQVGSGVYKINIGRTNDRYYTNVVTGAVTNVKIPNPFAQTSLVNDEDENIIHVASAKMRVSGSCILKSTLYTMDSIRSQNLANIVVATGMNREPTILSNLSSRRLMLRIQTELIDEVFDVTRIILYLKQLYTQKPQ